MIKFWMKSMPIIETNFCYTMHPNKFCNKIIYDLNLDEQKYLVADNKYNIVSLHAFFFFWLTRSDE